MRMRVIVVMIMGVLLIVRMLMAFVRMIMSVLVAFVCMCPFRRLRMGIVFEGVSGTQRVAFQARERRR